MVAELFGDVKITIFYSSIDYADMSNDNSLLMAIAVC
jgi:hypothetical protein